MGMEFFSRILKTRNYNAYEMTENFFLVLGKQDPIWVVDSTMNLAKQSLSFLRAQIFNKVFIHLKKGRKLRQIELLT